MPRPRWRKLCTELAHALRSHVISQHDNEVECVVLGEAMQSFIHHQYDGAVKIKHRKEFRSR